MDDAELVGQVLNGDTATYAELILRHGPGVYAYCRAQVWNEAAARDLEQEVFTRALEQLDSLENPETFRPWLYGIARNLCRAWRRDRANRSVSLSRLAPEGPVVCDECPPLRDEDRSAVRRLVRQAVRALPYRLRTVIILRYLGGLGYAEIAERLQCCEATVGNLLREARELLRERLGPDFTF